MASRFGVIAVYIMASGHNGTLYVGVTSDLHRRVYEHREGVFLGFTSDHHCRRLVWYEVHESIAQAMQRERTLKHWLRDWKLVLIERENPDWIDLYPTLV